MRKLRLGMIGGGEGALIGGVHRIAARLDGQWDLVAGALSSDPARAASSAATLGIAPDRSYADYRDMATAEAARADGIDAVAIVTPNHLHAGPAIAFLDAGIHVICDKPLAATLDDADAIARAAARSGKVFVLTHNYTGYAMVRQAREMVARGDLGTLRVVQVEYAQDWLTEDLEASGHRQAGWRTDPARSGEGGAVADIGTHAYNLTAYVTGLELEGLACDLTAFVPGRRVDDNVAVLMRFRGGARGMLWASQVAPGCGNALRLRLCGDKGGLMWEQERPEHLAFTPYGQPTRLLTRGGPDTTPGAARVCRLPAGHPEGFLEAFATLYADAAALIRHADGDVALPAGAHVPTLADGLAGMRFVAACLASSRQNAHWVDPR